MLATGSGYGACSRRQRVFRAAQALDVPGRARRYQARGEGAEHAGVGLGARSRRRTVVARARRGELGGEVEEAERPRLGVEVHAGGLRQRIPQRAPGSRRCIRRRRCRWRSRLPGRSMATGCWRRRGTRSRTTSARRECRPATGSRSAPGTPGWCCRASRTGTGRGGRCRRPGWRRSRWCARSTVLSQLRLARPRRGRRPACRPP